MRNKKHQVKAMDGTIIRVSMSQAKKVRQAFQMARRLKCKLLIHPDFTFSAVDKNGIYVYGHETTGKSLNAIRRAMGNAIELKKEHQVISA